VNDLPGKKQLESSGESHGFRLKPRQFAAGVIALVLFVFIVQNTDNVQVKFLAVSFETSQWLVLTVTALLGAAVGAALFARRQKVRSRRQA